MESMEPTMMDLVTEGEYSVYARHPSEADVELSGLSNMELSSMINVVRTALSGSNEDVSSYSPAPSEIGIDLSDYSESDVLTALSIFEGPESNVEMANSVKSTFTANSCLDQYSVYSQKDNTAHVELEDIQDYSAYSAAPSEAGVDVMDAPGSDVLTALSIYDGPEPNVQTAESIDSVFTANSIAEEYSVYSDKSSTANVEMEEATLVSTAADGCYSWYEAPRSEADCDMPRMGTIEKSCIVANGFVANENDLSSTASVSWYESPPSEADCIIPRLGASGKSCIGFAVNETARPPMFSQ